MPYYSSMFHYRYLIIFLFISFLLTNCRSSETATKSSSIPDREITESDERAIERLSRAIQYPTISYEDTSEIDYGPYEEFIEFLEENYPGLHETAEVNRIGTYSLLFKWKGSDPALKPALLLGHYDVVPVAEGSDLYWQYPAFQGEIAEGFIWGRGALDDKSGIMSIVEAVEQLIDQNFQPSRTIYIALHHDEEVGGLRGAKQISNYLEDRGVELEFLVDEGPPVAIGILENVDVPIALIGVAEKGSVNIELTYRQEGGHSSMPPRVTVISSLSRAINRIEQNPMDAYYRGLILETFEPLIPYMSFRHRLAFNNTWLFKGAIVRNLSKNAATNAALRTTAAKTIFEAGFKENVLPVVGRVIINFRLHPNDSIEDVERYVRRVIRNSDIEVRVMERARNASPVSNTRAAPYQALKQSIQEQFTGALVAPSLFVAASDSRHFHNLTTNVYRFRPIRATHDDRERVHGVDERIGIDNYIEMIDFQKKLITKTAGEL